MSFSENTKISTGKENQAKQVASEGQFSFYSPYWMRYYKLPGVNHQIIVRASGNLDALSVD
jgi:hypothetical protein